ncbi:MAG: FtsX-like permease family protein [Bacteroidales bacterium]|nr:FtsX-like permease family protein [Bacteroidales bacterium]
MFNYFIKITYRTFLRNKLNSLINIFGLAIGISSFILISLYVSYELNWDTYHKDHERIYLVHLVKTLSGKEYISEQTPGAIAFELRDKIPELEKTVCMGWIGGDILSSKKDKSFFEDNGYYADNSIFELFKIEFIAGNKNNSLTKSNSIVLNKSLALKHFGSTDVVGKLINTESKSYIISAVFDDMPINSKFWASYFVSLSNYKDTEAFDIQSDWESDRWRSFIKLSDQNQKELVSRKCAQIINTNFAENEQCSVYLGPLSKLHLFYEGVGKTGVYYIIMIYSFLGFLILILSGINFLNLSTGLNSIRAREIGIKKVFGSSSLRIARQFLGESILNSLVALVLAFGISEFLLPFYRIITDRILKINYIVDWKFVLFIVLIVIVLGLLAGLYPSIYLSKFNPIKALKNGTISSKKLKRFSLKKILILFQFIISIAFIIGTTGFLANAKYIISKDLGFEKERVFSVNINNNSLQISNIESLRNELKENSNIENVSISSGVPYSGYSTQFINWENALEEDGIKSIVNTAGDQFLPLYKIPIIKGRNFMDKFDADSLSCIVNEELVRQIGWDDPIGKKVMDNKYTIIGVIKDFHQINPINRIDPYVLLRHSGNLEGFKIFSIKLGSGYSKETTEFIKEKLNIFFPESYIEIQSVGGDQERGLNKLLMNISKTMMFFTVIAILIAFVGLISIVSFSIKQKVKEIGIRKALGASVARIYWFLSKEYFILLIVANIIAVPLGLFLLEAIPFRYKPDFNVYPVFVIIVSSFIVIFLSISYWVLKTARANPVDSLRYE